MKFKKGDKVRIKKDLEVGKMYNDKSLFISSMSYYKGKDTIISKVLLDYYFLDIDNGYWRWTDDMFESIEEIKIEENDIVKVNSPTLRNMQGRVLTTNIKLEDDKGGINFSNVYAIKINNTILLANKDDLELVKKHKREGYYNHGSEACKYETKGDRTKIILPSGVSASVKCFEGDKYDLELGLEIAYFKAKFKEASNKVEEKSDTERGL